jgi:flagellar biosynthesis protein FlhB
MYFLQAEPVYVISSKEVFWGAILVAVTMAIHVFGMLMVLRINNNMKSRLEKKTGYMAGLAPIMFASCLILLIHMIEVLIWALFFYWKGAFANISIAYYFSLNEYTTLGSKFNLPIQMRLFEGIISLAGLMAFALSTGILFRLATSFLEKPRKSQANQINPFK